MKSLIYSLNGLMSVSLYFLNTIVWFIPIFIFSLIKLIPINSLQVTLSRMADQCATFWISINSLNQIIFSRCRIDSTLPKTLTKNEWYLVISNHQSWVDILVLQRLFNRKIPFLKFFLKHNLIYVPFLGLAWWGLDFPFMKRYSKSEIAKNPSLKGKDLETTKKACKKYENKPVSIMNFVEGTRFHSSKLNSPLPIALGLKHTLPPKSAGIAFVLNAMGRRLTKIINVTICYSEGIPSYWDFVCGKVHNIKVEVETIGVDELFKNKIFSDSYFNSDEQKIRFQDYLNELWQIKDYQLTKIIENNKKHA